MERAKLSGSSPTKYARIFDKLRGVDFSTDPQLIDACRSPDAVNLVAGPGGYPEKRPGWRTVRTMAGPIWGMFHGSVGGEEVYLVHAGSGIWRWWPEAEETEEAKAPVSLRTEVWQGYSTAVAYGDKLWILTGKEYLVCGKYGESGSETIQIKSAAEDAKVPEISINGGVEGGGTALEAVNLLTDKRKAGFVGEGGYNTFKLPEEKVKSTGLSARIRNEITGVWEEVEQQRVKALAAISESTMRRRYENYKDSLNEGEDAKSFEEWAKGYICWKGVYFEKSTSTEDYVSGSGMTKGTFLVNEEYGVVALPQASAPWDATLSGADNLEITYEKAAEEGQDSRADLEGCTIAAIYENRIFLSGNDKKPSRDWRSGAEDPTYFPDTGYTMVGNDGSRIMGYRNVGESQAIIKEESGQDASIYLRTAGELNGTAVFPVRQGITGVGAVSKRAFANLLDDPLFLSRRGVYGITSNLVTAERTMANRSRFVDARLTAEPRPEEAAACSWNGMYLLSMGDGRIYVLDGKQNRVYQEGAVTGGNYGYECQYWTNIPAVCWMPKGEALWFGTKTGKLCRMNTDRPGMDRYSDDGAAIVAKWTTMADTCGDFMRYKTMVKKGSGVMLQPYARSSVKVKIRTDRDPGMSDLLSRVENGAEAGEVTAAQLAALKVLCEQTNDIFDWEDIDFTRFSFETDDGPRLIAFKKKIKKWKWLTVTVYNTGVNEGFGVYGIIVRYQKMGLV